MAGRYTLIDPDSMAVSLPDARLEEEKVVLDGFKSYLDGKEHFSPHTDIEITDFPAFISRKPDEPAAYCHKEQGKQI
ncbi:hypothetical protein ACFFL1_02675 [Samsonia erythrinae]|uniref:Uncharacterized protein n=1 Tax=Samsonia erythrinae TaxID=160434 RepID=A0A4R3VUS8_9GAMM|nr:hypothetical protein [Samsonia erythrinae]TCV09097.1 hypothetical protein EDC54_101623 [Samsonia erythrinae]